MFRFFPDEITRTYNDVGDGMDLKGLDMRFLLGCCKGENHHGKNCCAKVRIYRDVDSQTLGSILGWGSLIFRIYKYVRSLMEHKTTSVEQVRHCVSGIQLQV